MKRYELYVLTFPNNKIYIGISSDSKKRFSQHKSQALAGSKFPVHQAIRKYGHDNVARTIKCIGARDYIADLEVKMIAALQTQDRSYGYNVTLGGDIGPMHSAR